MKSLPRRWSIYANLQAEMSSNRRVSERSWGMEAALKQFLCSPENLDLSEPDSAEKAAANERRRERRREKLRLVYISNTEQAVQPEDALDARHSLNAIQLKTAPNDWSLLCQVGLGENYQKISLTTRATPGSLRARVRRLRVMLAA